VCDSAATRPSSQITLGKLVQLLCGHTSTHIHTRANGQDQRQYLLRRFAGAQSNYKWNIPYV